MTTYEKVFAILALLLFVAWMVTWAVDEEQHARKRDKE